MLHVPFLKPEDIEEKAQEILHQYTDGSIPVDVDHIIEFGLEMDVRPLPGLRDRAAGDGLTLRDWTAICYDQSQARVRVRFTLAHEVGHVVLHRQLIDGLPTASTVDEWIDIYLQLPDEALDRLEWQANFFAGNLLVPRRHLEAEFIHHLPEIKLLTAEAERRGLRRHQYLDFAKSAMASKLAPAFDVSTDVIERRIAATKLDEDLH